MKWYGHVLIKDENDWVKKCMDYEVQGVRPRGRPKKVIEKNVQTQQLCKEDVMDLRKLRKLIRHRVANSMRQKILDAGASQNPLQSLPFIRSVVMNLYSKYAYTIHVFM